MNSLPEQTRQWFEQLPAPKSMVAVRGADHFFQGYLEEVQAVIVDFVRTLSGYISYASR